MTARAQAAPPEIPEPEPPRLRLLDSPALPLLELYRHAAGRSASPRIRWQQGPWSEWLRRTFEAHDWQSLLPERLRAGPDAPISPAPAPLERRGAPAFQHAMLQPVGFPFVGAEGHWFVAAERDEPLTAPDRLLPPWLRRLDPHYAQALIALHGCGRGGACSPGAAFPADAFAAFWSALAPPELPTPWWICREREARVMRYGQEQDVFVLLHCDGSVPDYALERLSVLARPPGIAAPEHLPETPAPGGRPGEWMPSIRLLHPRLLWVLHRIGLVHPWKAIYIYSGYRPSDAPPEDGTHVSNHALGRALDIKVDGVSREELLALCWKLPDLGCGYYPNHPFVHIDVRVRGTGNGVWIDDSMPGQPSRFVAEWPGVVEGGAVVWKPDGPGSALRR